MNCIFPHIIVSCKNIVSCLREYRVFKADCNLWAAFFSDSDLSCFKQCCNVHLPLQLLTAILNDCILCRNLMFWKRYRMIEGRLNITTKGRMHFYRKEHCMFGGMLYISRGYCFSYCIALKENCSLWMKGILWNEDITAKGTLYLLHEILRMCSD